MPKKHNEEKIKALRKKQKDLSALIGDEVVNGTDPSSEKIRRLIHRREQVANELKRELFLKQNAEKKAFDSLIFDSGRKLLKQIATEALEPVPYAKPVLKKDDPAGYERYKAYKRYSSLRNKAMKSLTLDQVSQWFESEKQAKNELAYVHQLLKNTIVMRDGKFILDWKSPLYEQTARYLQNLRDRSDSNCD